MREEKKSSKREPGFGISLMQQFRLILRLIADRRVNFFLKLLPIGTLVYMIAPDFFPVVDDVLVVGLGTYTFIEMCPPEVVEEHRRYLRGKGVPEEDLYSNDVVDGQLLEAPEKED